MIFKSDILVGGEPAAALLATIRAFTLTSHNGLIYFHNTAVGEAAASYARAFDRIELQVLTHAANCSHPEEHATIDEHTYNSLVLDEMVYQCKKALDDRRVEALWML